MTNTQSRRSFLLNGAAAASTVALTPSALGAVKRVRIHNPNLPAGAAGTLWIGGDLQVNRMGLGTTEFTTLGGVPAADPAAIRALLRRAVDLGVNHLDCADNYGSGLVTGLCERFIYDALFPYPSDLVIATKGGQVRAVPQPGAPFRQSLDGRPEHLRAACEASLKRLGLEQIPLYYMHQPDPKVPYEDSMGELGRLQNEGKIRHIGISNVKPEHVTAARSVVKVVAVQNQYNILARGSDEILATCEREHMVFIPFSPLGGRTRQGPKNLQDALQGRETGEPAHNPEDVRLAGFQALADERHISLAQVTLAWLLARSPLMMVIPGTTRIDHLNGDIAAAKVHLTKKEMAQLEQPG